MRALLLLALVAAPLALSAEAAVSADVATVDLVLSRNLVYARGVVAPALPGCIVCVTGPMVDLDRYGEEGQSEEPLPPGQYYVRARFQGGDCTGFPSFLRLSPMGGAWKTAVFVWRDHEFLAGPPQVQDYTNRGNLVIPTRCHGDAVLGEDLLLLPQGNLRTSFLATLLIEDPVSHVVTVDRDFFPG